MAPSCFASPAPSVVVFGYSRSPRRLLVAAGVGSVAGAGKPEEVKKAILRSVSNTNCGKGTTREQRQQILKQIEELENLNTVKSPVDSELLSGNWALVYVAPIDDENVDKYAGTQEGPFLARIKPLAFGKVRQTRSRQIIDTNEGIVKNIADFRFFSLNGTLCINGKAVKDLSPGKANVRLLVTFESFELRLGKLSVARVPLSFINPRGWVDTTYLDESLRVGRGDKGSIFVAVRTKL